jgi:mitogen-activated protein kinase 15
MNFSDKFFARFLPFKHIRLLQMAASSESIEDAVVTRYSFQKRLGKGSYGIVWKAMDRGTNEILAVKKCFDCFQNKTDSQRIFREISLLQQLNGHPHIIRLFDVIKSKSGRDLYMVCEYMDTDLNAVIKSGILEPIHAKYICYQMLSALKYMHSAGVVHRDIKPSNILIDSKSCVKICDFGLARVLSNARTNVLTSYVATRWYRAPEVILGCSLYDFAVDIWSLGVILAEMILGKPLFPGTSTLNQLERIIELTGWPTDVEIEGMCSSEKLLGSVSSRIDIKPLCEVIQGASVESLDLIRQLLRFHPSKRLTAASALNHPYVIEFRTGSEAESNGTIQIAVDDNIKLRSDEYQQVLYAELERSKLAHEKEYREIMSEVMRGM